MEPPKCFICEQKHWASEECPDVSGLSESKEGNTGSEAINVVRPVTEQATDSDTVDNAVPDVFCESCGTNLSARDRDRKRRAAYMKRKRNEQ